jgi:hypothetical protein
VHFDKGLFLSNGGFEFGLALPAVTVALAVSGGRRLSMTARWPVGQVPPNLAGPERQKPATWSPRWIGPGSASLPGPISLVLEDADRRPRHAPTMPT